MFMNVTMAHFKVLSQHLPEETMKNDSLYSDLHSNWYFLNRQEC
jgi:hypothetical protein